MKKNQITKILYYLRIIVFIIHLIIVFNLLYITLRMSYFGTFFLVIEYCYSINILIEMISSKLRYKRDYVYNLMNICYFGYLVTLYLKIKNNYLTPYLSFNFLRNNFIVLAILLILIIIYSKIIVNKRQEKLN
ncbi:MAG: hypothetical protein J6X02_00850 [Bacilli bacterium]|nr:hypothetical protein [Bacilli bacterium]